VTVARQQTGRRGEDLVATALWRRGARIVARNARAKGVRGEIDLVALDNGDLVFVEVKTRHTGNLLGPERPVLAVGAQKQRKLRALAIAWLGANRGTVPPHRSLRFDVVGIVLGNEGQVLEWEWLEAAF
jgi:putative endonuclease